MLEQTRINLCRETSGLNCRETATFFEPAGGGRGAMCYKYLPEEILQQHSALASDLIALLYSVRDRQHQPFRVASPCSPRSRRGAGYNKKRKLLREQDQTQSSCYYYSSGRCSDDRHIDRVKSLMNQHRCSNFWHNRPWAHDKINACK